jgi:ABC-type uncharacterized transport system auxiliary subunit
MKKHFNALALILALLPALAGCARVRPTRYYTLNLPPAPDPPAAEGVQSSIAVREFQSPVYLRQGPIVYRTTPEEIGFYEYHRWAADPRLVATNSVLDHLRASGRFSFVSMYDGHSDIDYVLTGRLEKLEEVDHQGGVKVEVAISAQMTRVATGVMVWSNAVSEVGTVSQRNVSGVVSQMNRTMAVAIDKLLSTVPAQLTSSKR